MSGSVKTVPFIRLEEPWDTEKFILEELRSDVVCSIIEMREKIPPLQPFTLMAAHEAMYGHDVRLSAILVHPAFVPLCEKMVKPWLGHTVMLFEHHEVPPAEVYGVCEPEFLGVLPVHKGRAGAFRVTDNIVWGEFSSRAGV